MNMKRVLEEKNTSWIAISRVPDGTPKPLSDFDDVDTMLMDSLYATTQQIDWRKVNIEINHKKKCRKFEQKYCLFLLEILQIF